MGLMKKLAERVSMAMGYKGEINPSVLLVGQYALDLRAAHRDLTLAKAISIAVRECKGL